MARRLQGERFGSNVAISSKGLKYSHLSWMKKIEIGDYHNCGPIRKGMVHSSFSKFSIGIIYRVCEWGLRHEVGIEPCPGVGNIRSRSLYHLQAWRAARRNDYQNPGGLCGKGRVVGSALLSRKQPDHGNPAGRVGGNNWSTLTPLPYSSLPPVLTKVKPSGQPESKKALLFMACKSVSLGLCMAEGCGSGVGGGSRWKVSSSVSIHLW